MIPGLNGMVQSFKILMDVFGDTFRDIIQLIEMVRRGAAYALQVIATMPISFQFIFIALVSYYLIFIVIKLGG